MMCNSIEPRDRIFVKVYGFCLLLKIWAKILLNTWVVSTAKNFLAMLDNLLQMHSKLLLKKQFNKKQNQPVI